MPRGPRQLTVSFVLCSVSGQRIGVQAFGLCDDKISKETVIPAACAARHAALSAQRADDISMQLERQGLSRLLDEAGDLLGRQALAHLQGALGARKLSTRKRTDFRSRSSSMTDLSWPRAIC